MIANPPRLRSDLVLSEQQTADGTSLIVKDPVFDRFFRFGPVERFIAEQLDARTPIDVVRERTEERFGAVLAPETLSAFVRHLDDNALLDTVEARARAERKERRKEVEGWRLRGSLLYLRFPLVDPDRFITRLAGWVRPLFSAHFLVSASLLILLAVAIVLSNGSDLAAQSRDLFRLSTIPLALVLLVVIISAHECAHAVTCKRFGGEVHEMGFMLFYFQPAFYCNVSDAWLFPEKAKRLWVSFAGVFFELFLWAMATVTWRLTETDTPINHVALAVMTISGIKSLVNLNPFIKLDGYYLVTDLVDIPNLRKKSFRYVGDGVKRILGVGAEMTKPVSWRERRMYLVYGLVATIFSLSLLAYVYIAAGRFLIEIRQPEILVLLTGLVSLRGNQYYQRIFGGSSRAPTGKNGGDRSTRSEHGHASSAPLKRSSPGGPGEGTGGKAAVKTGVSVRRQAVWLALCVALVALLFLGRMQLRIRGPVNVLPQENAEVRTGVEGTVDQILVDEGDRVAAGDVIARLSDRTLRAELVQTDAEIRETRAVLRKLEAGPTQEEIAVARAAVERAEDRLGYARARLDRLEGLLATNSVPRQEVEDAREVATTADNDLAAATAELDVLLRGSRPEDIAATRARVDRLESQRSYLEDQLRRLDVVAPASGIIATPSRELMLLPGRVMGKGDLVAKVYDFKTVAAQIVVAEKDIGDVRVGQPVVLRARAYPASEFRGTVIAIATSADGSTGSDGGAGPDGPSGPGRAFVVTTHIDNSSLLLKPGMTGQAKVLAGERRIVDLIVRRLFRTLRVEVWSWW